MYLEKDSLYVGGLVNMASSCSKKIGLSYMDAVCFTKKDFSLAFANFYHVPLKEVKIHPVNLSLSQLLTNILGKKEQLINGLIHWLEKAYGHKETVCILDEDSNLINLLSESNIGYNPFYFLEDIIFIEFSNKIICLMIGNDE